jgi:hypothetical protein
MTDYQYTYDARQDYAGSEGLSLTQQAIMHEANLIAREFGEDRQDVLRRVFVGQSQLADIAAVADVWGGPGAGEKFLR